MTRANIRSSQEPHLREARACKHSVHSHDEQSVPCSAAFSCLRIDVTLPWTFTSSVARFVDETPVEETKQLVLSSCSDCPVQAFKAFMMNSVLCSTRNVKKHQDRTHDGKMKSPGLDILQIFVRLEELSGQCCARHEALKVLYSGAPHARLLVGCTQEQDLPSLSVSE